MYGEGKSNLRDIAPVESSEEVHKEETDNSETEETVTRRSHRNRKATEFYSPTAFVACNHDERPTLKEAIASRDCAKCKQAIILELGSLNEHRTWHVATVPVGTKILPKRFVFRKKLWNEVLISLYKARLVVKGFYKATYGTPIVLY